MAVADGWVCTVKWSAAAALTATLLEVALARPALVKASVILVATLCERLVKAITPLATVRLVAPCSVPLPAERTAVTTVLLSPAIKFPNGSSTRTTGCDEKATPAVAAGEGWF